jgi:hypothetical protein
MAEKSGFSFSSIIMSYFLVAGGSVLAFTLAILLKLGGGMGMMYAIWGVGALVGGFVAGRASQGSTVLEPAIGAVLLAATFIGLVLATPLGSLVWTMFPEAFKKYSAIFGGVMLGGGIIGAFISEKLLGESTTSGLPWILYVAIASLGAVFMAIIVGATLAGNKSGLSVEQSAAHKMTAMAIGFGLGALVTGMVSSASSRIRIHGPVFIGSIVGFMSFALLIVKLAETGGGHVEGDKGSAFAGLAIFATFAAVISVIGSVVGWAAFGKKSA